MSEPLKDKRLEAVVRMTLAVAHCDEEDKDITIDALREAASNADEIDIAKSRAHYKPPSAKRWPVSWRRLGKTISRQKPRLI